MINKTLFELIQEKLKRGLDKDTISKELSSYDWSKEEIKECFMEQENKIIKNLILITIIILILVGLSWFIPVIPYKYLTHCDGECSNNIRTMTLKQFLSSDDIREIKLPER